MADPYIIKMPQLSDTMTEGTVVTWEKEIGEFIERGTIVATVETDKAIMDVEVFREGYLSGPLTPVDSVIPVGEAMGFLVATKEEVSAQGNKPAAKEAEPAKAKTAPAAQAAAIAAPSDAYMIKMPQLSDTMTEGVVVSWEKEIGDAVKRGEVVAQVETDKAIMDVEIFRDGILSGPLADVDSVVAVGDAIGYLVQNKAAVIDAKAKSTGSAKPEAPAAAPKHEPAGTAKPKTRIPAQPSGATPAPRPKQSHATPYARQLAGAHGIDLNAITGSGPGGAIVAADVLNAEVQTSARRVAAGPITRRSPASGAP